MTSDKSYLMLQRLGLLSLLSFLQFLDRAGIFKGAGVEEQAEKIVYPTGH